MTKKSLYERYYPYGIHVTVWLEMRKEGFTFDDLDPSKNDPAEDDIKKAKKWRIQWTMRSSEITVEDMKKFATYINPNPLARAPPSLPPLAGDDDGVPNKRLAPLDSTGAAADDKEQMDDGFPNKRHCHDLAPTGAAAAADDDDKEQIDDGVPNKPDGLPQEG